MKTRALHFGIALVALCLLGLGTVVAGRSEGTAPVVAHATSPSLDRLAVVTGGIVTALAPGRAIPIAGELTATVELHADPGVRYARVLSITLESGSSPVQDATVTIQAHMLTMDHGAFAATALPSGDGRYVARLPFVMPGEWQLDLRVASPSQSGDLALDIEEFD